MKRRLLACFTAALMINPIISSREADAHASLTIPDRVHASWYGPKFHGRTMANGQRFDMNDPTVVAHKTLPFETRLQLRNPKTDKSIVVVVQDRGPFIPGRELDVSKAAAQKLGFIKSGVVELEVKVLD